MSSDFTHRYGPVAVVTGASSGMGEHMARQLAAKGLDLVVCARRTDQLEALAAELGDAHDVAVRAVPVDLSDPEAPETVAEATNHLDVGLLVCNAGFGLKGLHHEQKRDRLDAMVAVNSTAPMHLARLFSPRLIDRGRGGILITSSIEGFFGYPYSAAYAASKAFSLVLGEGLWGELRPHGVDVLVIAPGSTETEALALQGIDSKQLPGLMAPADVARTALSQLGRRPVTIVGPVNKAGMAVLRATPLRARLRLVGWGMRRTLERSRAKLQGTDAN